MAVRKKRNILKIKKHRHTKGFALIFVLVFIAMIMGIVSDVIYQTQIRATTTLSEQNVLKAQVAAQTGLELALVLLKLNGLAVQYENNPVLPLPKQMYKVLNGQPIGSSAFEDIEKLGGKEMLGAIAPELFSALKSVPGYFVLNITSENSKFNVNLLQSRSYQVAREALLRLFSTDDSQGLLELFDFTPQKIVDNMSNYIKIGIDNSLQAVTRSDYNAVGAQYEPKHAALESLEELRRIPGFNYDDIYKVYSPYFTIWPISGGTGGGSLNLNTAPTELVATLMTPYGQPLQEDVWDKFDDYRTTSKFRSKDIKSWFQNNLTSYQNDKIAADLVSQVFGDSDTVFRVESKGVVNGVEQTLVVILSYSQNTTDSNPSAQNTTATGNTTPNKTSQQSNQQKSFQILYSQWQN